MNAFLNLLILPTAAPILNFLALAAATSIYDNTSVLSDEISLTLNNIFKFIILSSLVSYAWVLYYISIFLGGLKNINSILVINHESFISIVTSAYEWGNIGFENPFFCMIYMYLAKSPT